MRFRLRPPATFTTERLQLRLPQAQDAEEIFSRYAQDSEVTRHLAWRPHTNVQETRDFLEWAIATMLKGTSVFWVINKRSDAQLLGMIELRITGDNVSFGYVLARDAWGKGYMTEAVSAIVQWSLLQSDILRIWTVCDIENPGSARVLEKAGLKLEGILRRWTVLPNLSQEPRDCYCYAIDKRNL